MRIAVYSGSFDPLHIGHKSILEHLDCCGLFDWTYLIVSPQNPLKEAKKALSAGKRFDAAVEAVRRHPGLHVWVDDIEMKMAPPEYTVRTLDALKEREPGNSFTLAIGADNLDNIHQWRDYRRILTEYGVVVYSRKGFDQAALRDALLQECPDYRITLIDSPIIEISSTQIREGEAGGIDMSTWRM